MSARPGKTTIACCLWLGTSMGQEVLAGVGRFVRDNPGWAMLNLDIHDERVFINNPSLGAQGVIVQPFTPRHLGWIRRQGLVGVAVSQLGDSRPLPVVSTNDRQVGSMAADHFLRLRHESFAFVGRSGHTASELRKEGFVSRLREAGYGCAVFEIPYTFRGSPHVSFFEGRFVAWLRALPSPAALLAFVDATAASVMEAAEVVGRRVPEDLAVMGVGNDLAVQESVRCPLSTVVLANREVGFRAAELVARLIGGAEPPDRATLVPPLMVHERRSTDVLAIDDRLVRRSVEHIRANLGRTIYVNELCSVTGLSRRPLEKRFAATLGLSPHAEINRLRIQRARELLLSADMKIEEIAQICGFVDGRHLTLVFRKQCGMAPRDFRARHSGRR